MSDMWDFYFARVNGEVASLFVDLGIDASAPMPDRPHLLWVWVQLQAPRSDGLSSSDEAPALYAIEAALNQTLAESHQAEPVGRITTAGRREFYFYAAHAEDLAAAVAQALHAHGGYHADTGNKHDPDWKLYRDVLYPTPEDQQRIHNRNVIEKLQAEGDPLTQPRLVSHWAYFKTATERTQFVQRAQQAGFRLVDEYQRDASEAKSDYPWGVSLERMDRVDWAAINEVTLDLFHWAQAVNGDYDGWESSVELGQG